MRSSPVSRRRARASSPSIPTAGRRYASPCVRPAPATRWSSPARDTSRARSSASAGSRSTTAPSRQSCWPNCAGSGDRVLALTLAEIAAACGGRLEGGDPETVVVAVCSDSRRLAGGELFVGLRGDKHDGDAYAAQALAAGAAAVMVRAATAAGLPAGASRVVVDDGLAALQRLGTAVHRRGGVKVVAITGSAGKTSTKDILAALLRPVARTVATSANLNNEIGVPLTLLDIEQGTEVVVVEMAMRGHGQIRDLARIALPDIGVDRK